MATLLSGSPLHWQLSFCCSIQFFSALLILQCLCTLFFLGMGQEPRTHQTVGSRNKQAVTLTSAQWAMDGGNKIAVTCSHSPSYGSGELQHFWKLRPWDPPSQSCIILWGPMITGISEFMASHVPWSRCQHPTQKPLVACPVQPQAECGASAGSEQAWAEHSLLGWATCRQSQLQRFLVVKAVPQESCNTIKLYRFNTFQM